MSKDVWLTLRVALVCAVVISVIYGNANNIDWDEFSKSAQIVILPPTPPLTDLDAQCI